MKHRPDKRSRPAEPEQEVCRRNKAKKPAEYEACDKVPEFAAFIRGAFRRPSFIIGLLAGYLINHFLFRPLFFR